MCCQWVSWTLMIRITRKLKDIDMQQILIQQHTYTVACSLLQCAKFTKKSRMDEWRKPVLCQWHITRESVKQEITTWVFLFFLTFNTLQSSTLAFRKKPLGFSPSHMKIFFSHWCFILLLSCLPKFHWLLPPPSFFPAFHHPLTPPSSTPSLQRSSGNSGVCHCMLAVELRATHSYVISGWNEGEETQKHGEGEMKVIWGTCHAAIHPSPPTHTHTNPPSLHNNNRSIATHKCRRTGSGGSQHRITPQNQVRQWVNRKKQELYKEKEGSTLLCLQVCEALKRKFKQTATERRFENNCTPILNLYCHYAWFAWWQTMAFTLKQKLSQVHSKAFLLKQTND